MSIFVDIHAAMDSRLNDMIGLPPVAWENHAYEPTPGVLYLRPTLLPAPTEGATLGAAGMDRNEGIYQIDVFAEAGQGKKAAVAMADTIAEQFKPVVEVTYNGRIVRCVTVSRSAASVSEGWYQIPVRVNYLSFVAKR